MEETTLPVKPKFTTNIPRTDKDLGGVVDSVSTKWAASTWVTLLWKTQSQFAADANQYNNAISSKDDTAAIRPQVTRELALLDKKINGALQYVKSYLLDKYGKEKADSYFAGFGIVRSGKELTMPNDRQSRKAALKLMVKGIATEGFNDKTYGKDFWKPIADAYGPLVDQSKTTDSAIATKAGSKNILKADLKKALNAIILVIKANYPDNYKEELRNWGFQKEKY